MRLYFCPLCIYDVLKSGGVCSSHQRLQVLKRTLCTPPVAASDLSESYMVAHVCQPVFTLEHFWRRVFASTLVAQSKNTYRTHA